MQEKCLANNSAATVVLISSEGMVVPVIQAFSRSSRSTRMFEIGDVEDDLAEEHLIKMGLPDNLAKKLVGYFGGRCIYLYNARFNHSRYREMKKYTDDDEMCSQIIEDVCFKDKRSMQHIGIMQALQFYNYREPCKE